MGEGSLYDPRPRRSRHQAGARRSDRGGISGSRLPHHAAALWRHRAHRYRQLCRSNAAISATFKDLPGGQVLGPTFDYTHRLIDFLLEAGVRGRPRPPQASCRVQAAITAGHRSSRRRRPDRAQARPATPGQRALVTSPASPLELSVPAVTCACRISPAATRASFLPSAIQPSAATAAPIPSPAKSASARSSSNCLSEDAGFRRPARRDRP